MIQSNQKQSLLVPYELPKFISEDPQYANFTLFLKAYYEWMEQENNVLDFSKSLLSYMDVDTTTTEFLDYFVNDFMSYFPQDILADKSKVIKIAKQLYQSKGTPASFQFLFRVLYNSDVDFFYTKDAVLKPSSGKWYVPRSLKLASSDKNFLAISNLRVFGNISKSIATIEAATYDGLKTEVFISNIERLFQSGETVTVVDSNNQPVYFLNEQIVPKGTIGSETLTALIVGQISKIIINPTHRGLTYNVADPVVFYGGLNPAVLNPLGAVAQVGDVTTGSIQRITVDTEGYGYTGSIANNIVGGANTLILFSNIVGNSPKAPIAVVGGLNPIGEANATFVPVDSAGLKQFHYLGNVSGGPIYTYFSNVATANADSGNTNNQILNILSTDYDLTTVISVGDRLTINSNTQIVTSFPAPYTHIYLGAPLTTGANGLVTIARNITTGYNGANGVGPTGNYYQQAYQFANNLSANANTTLANAFTFTAFATFPISSVIVQNQGGGLNLPPTVSALSEYTTEHYDQGSLSNLGILAPIQILNGGIGYANNDQIVLLGGSGYGAYANVLSVNATGTIQTVGYTKNNQHPYPLGGLGFFYSTPAAVVARFATGVISATSTSNVVTGSGTNFTANLSNGNILVTGTNIVIGTIQRVVNANSVILTSNAAVPAFGNSFYQSTATLKISGTLGTGATFTQTSNRIGEITSFNIIDNGEDYISAPIVSLAVQDLIVSNVSPSNMASAGDVIYQGANVNTATYIATVDSIIALENFVPATSSIYQLRVFNYNSKPKFNLPLKIDSKLAAFSLVSGYTAIHNTTFINTGGDTRFDAANGIMTYGDGNARANATFLNGLVIGNGQYLDTTGQPSAFDVLQSTEYNNYTYEITLSKEIQKYREVLLNLVHPSGMQVLGRIAMSSSNTNNFVMDDELHTGHNLSYYVGLPASVSIANGTFASPSNNIVQFNNLYGANIATFLVANTSELAFTYGTGYNDTIKSLVTKINAAANTVTLADNVWTYIANVAVVAVQANSNSVINIQSLTNSYNIVNNGQYSNTMYPLKDIIRVNDSVSVNGVSQTVIYINSTYSALSLSGPITTGANNYVGYVSVSKAFNSLSNNVQIYGPVGEQYYAQLGTEDGNILTTEDDLILLLG